MLYKFGSTMSDTVDQIMPNEEQMQQMMTEMQGGMGGPPPSMWDFIKIWLTKCMAFYNMKLDIYEVIFNINTYNLKLALKHILWIKLLI